MKTLAIVFFSLAGGAVGACLLMKYCKTKKKGCAGCGCSDATKSTPAPSAPPPAATPATIAPGDQVQSGPIPGVMADQGSGAVAADGGWIKQPRQW